MTRFITFISGKGGVGKTTTTLNTGFALNKLGAKVTLLDANLVTPNLALHLGVMKPTGTLNQFLAKEKELEQVTYVHESNISLIPSSPSYAEYQKTNPQKLNEVFEHLENTVDFVLVDAPSGLGYEVNQVLKNTDEAIIVVNPNLSSVMDALKTIQLAKANNNIVSGIVLNMSNKGKNELKPKEVEEILGYPIISDICTHSKIKKAAHQQIPLNHLYPRSKPAKGFTKVAEHLCMKDLK